MFKFKCYPCTEHHSRRTRQGKSPVTRIFKCNSSNEAKDEAAKLIPPHLYRQAWIRNPTERTRWRKSSDWCSVILEII